MVKYLSDNIAEGIDKSKLIPIYDEAENLLWPKSEEEKTDYSLVAQNNNTETGPNA